MWAWFVAAPAAASITEVEVRVEHIEAKPQIVVSITGDPCPEAELAVQLDGKALEAVSVPTTCATQQKLGKSWWRLAFAGPPPRDGDHTLEIAAAGADPVRATFTLGARPEVRLPAKISHAPVEVLGGGRLRGQLALRPTTSCSAVFKAPLRGSGPEYAVTFVPKVCEGKGTVTARLTSDLEVTCDGPAACVGEAVWAWTVGERPFDLQEGEAAPPLPPIRMGH